VYLIVRGQVSLVDPEALGEEPGRMGPGHCVGLMAFLTGSPHHGAAVTAGACDLLAFSRPDFEDLLQTSSGFAAAVGHWIESEPVARYLSHCHRFDDARLRGWVNRALAELTTRRRLPDAVPVDRGREAFLAMARLVGKFPVFKGLPEADLEEISDRLLHRTFADGEAFFQAGERADRLFILQEGDVGLLDPSRPSQPPRPILPGQAFGELSFVTGARHSVTAVARTEVRAWVLRKLDFEEMLRRSPELEEAVRRFLARPLVSAYLEHRQGFAPEKAGRWLASALRSMNGNHLLPSLTGVIEGLEDQPSAPVAIWVGLLMDGIPEALAIGAQMILVPLSPSFLAGLFISNFPEALSSSSGMRQQGFPRGLIMLLWSGLAIAIGLLALAGSVLFAGAPERWVSLVKATAAGAMLTVISETMLPESSARGGSVVGLSTILGFLTIILIDHRA
jgi:CRP-like cAMP-binding protein